MVRNKKESSNNSIKNLKENFKKENRIRSKDTDEISINWRKFIK